MSRAVRALAGYALGVVTACVGVGLVAGVGVALIAGGSVAAASFLLLADVDEKSAR